MRLDPALQSAMLAAVPNMRAFALSLCHQRDRGYDLVQEALLRALSNIQSFKPGTKMTAWLFTILRNITSSTSIAEAVTKSRTATAKYFVGHP